MIFILEQALNSLLTFFIGILIVNVSGIEVYGDYAVYILLSLFSLNIVYNLVTAPCLMSDDKSNELGHIITSMLICVIVALVIALGIVAVDLSYKYVWLPFYCVVFCFDDCFRKINLKNKFLSSLFCRYAFIGLALLIYFFCEELNALSGFLLLYCGSLTLYFTILIKRSYNGSYSISYRESYSIYKSNYLFLTTSLSQWMSTNAINLVAYGLLSSVYLGAVKSAQNVASIVNFAIIATESFLLSRLIGKKGHFEKKLIKIGLALSLSLLALILVMYSFRDLLIALIYQESVELIVEAFSYLVFLPLGTLLNLLIKVYCRLSGESNSIFYTSVSGGIVALLYYYLLTNMTEITSLTESLLVASYSTVMFWFVYKAIKVGKL